MKKYISFFRMRFELGLQYRTAALAGIVTQFFWGAMNILMYTAFYESDPSAFPMTLEATITYVWLQQALLLLFAAWLIEHEIFDDIVSGNVVYELCRPVSIYDMWFARSIANRLSRAVLRSFPILFVAALLPRPYGLSAPASIEHFMLFLLTMALGFLVTVAFFMLVYALTFFTISPSGLRILVSSVVEFFAGAIIPLPFFPNGVRRVFELLPFAAMQNVPLRIYSASMGQAEMARAIALQVFWLAALILAGRGLCAFAVRRMTVQGG
ncbi:MAG: ABC transporter permease [Clostridia bacterium]|nr:ABC transporter permease [Clostridia bacterium]